MLGLSKSQKNCHEEICSCLKVSCSMHLLAMGIISLFASSWNTAFCSAATNLEGESVKKKFFLLFTCQSDKKSQVQSNHQSQKLPQTWVLAVLLHESTSSSLKALHGNDALIQDKPLEKSSWLPLYKEIRAYCYNKWLWSSIFRSVMAAAWGISGPWGVLKPVLEECGWQNGFTPVLKKKGDAVKKETAVLATVRNWAVGRGSAL